MPTRVEWEEVCLAVWKEGKDECTREKERLIDVGKKKKQKTLLRRYRCLQSKCLQGGWGC